jgi:hypothetical protein
LSLSAGADGLTSTAGFDLGNSVATDITANVLSANTVNIGTGAIGIGDDNFLVIETLVPGGFRPSNDDTYLLGNTSYRWSEVHANVYYGDGSQLTGINATTNIIANGNTSVVIPSLDGPAEVIVDGNTWSFDDQGVLTFPNSANTDGLNFNGTANDVVSLNAFDTDGNTVSIQAQGNTAAAVIETYFEGANNRFTWSFDNSGTLNFPASQTSIFGGYDNDFTINTSNTGNAVYTFTFSQFGDLSVPVNLDVSGNVYTDNIVGTGFGNVAITANTQSWLFDNNGTLTLPGNSQILPAGNTGVRLSAGASDATGLFLNNTGDAEIYAASNVSVYTDAGNIGWTFDNTGNLTVPGNIIGNGSALTSITGANVTGTVAQATLSNTVAVSSVLLNQEYVPALLVANTGNLGIKAADGLANITYNPAQNRLTVENINANTVSLGNASTITTADYAIGYRDIPQIALSTNVTAALTDAGKHFYSTTAGNLSILIPTNANVAFPTGTAFTVVVNAAGNVLISADTGVNLYLAGNSTAGNRVVSTYGMATVMKVSSDTWFINGTGVS